MNRTTRCRMFVVLGAMLLCIACETTTLIATDDVADASIDAPLAPFECDIPLDLDEDGEVDIRCESGTDCDDTDERIGPHANESCGNGVDDDCDDRVDEAECSAPSGASCSAPTVVTSSTTVSAAMRACNGECGSGCEGPWDVLGYEPAHHFLRIDLTAPSSVRLTIGSDPGNSLGTGIAMLGACEGELIACAPPEQLDVFGNTATALAFAELPAGSHLFELLGQKPEDGGADHIELTIAINAPIEPPPNDACENATLISNRLGTTTYTVDFAASMSSDPSCTFEGAPDERRDVFYRLELDSPANVLLNVAADVPGSYGVAVHSGDCTDSSATRCVADATLDEILVRSLPAGTHLIELTGPDAGRATLAITLAAPTVAAPGETCSDPIRLVSGENALDSFDDRDLDLDVPECGLPLHFFSSLPRDIVYDFELAETSDVEIVVRDPASQATATIQQVCGASGPLQRCSEAVPVAPEVYARRTRAAALAPGRYYVVVQGESRTSVEVSFVARPTVRPTAIAGNIDCASAFAVLTTPGLHAYTGTIAAGTEGVFRIELTSPADLGVYVYPLSDSGPSAGFETFFGTTCSGSPSGFSRFEGPVQGGLDSGTYFVSIPNPDGAVGSYEVTFDIRERT